MAGDIVVSAAVEGMIDEAIARRLIAHAGAVAGPVYGRQGKAALRQKIGGYLNAAQWDPWLIVVDLDRDFECAPPLCAEWLDRTAPMLCFRVAVRQVEAWLLADAEGVADFLGVAKKRVPTDPEAVSEPKTTMINLARASRRRAIREDMVPREGSGRQVGPAYTSRMIEFVSSSWRPNVAAQRSDSLRRAIRCLRRLTQAQ